MSYRFSAAEVLEKLGPVAAVPVYDWPANGAGLKQTIAADQKTWKLELPPKFVERLKLAPTACPVDGQ